MRSSHFTIDMVDTSEHFLAMARCLLTFVMVLLLANPMAGAHAFSHSHHTAADKAAGARDHGAKTACAQICDGERSLPCCADMSSHCGALAIEMKSCAITSPVPRLAAWRFGSNAEFAGLRSEAETPPPRS